jgi:hypothetical protein
MGSSFRKCFDEVLGDDDECTVFKLQLVVDGKNIDTNMVVSWVSP